MADKDPGMGAALGKARTKKATAKPAIAHNNSEDKSKSHYRPSRAGKKAITGRYDPAVSRQLRSLAVNEDSSVEALLAEAINLLFAERGLPQIAPSKED